MGHYLSKYLGGLPLRTTGGRGGPSWVRSTVGGRGGLSTLSFAVCFFCVFWGTANWFCCDCCCSTCLFCVLAGIMDIAEFRFSEDTLTGALLCWGCWLLWTVCVCCFDASALAFLWFEAGVTVIPLAARTSATAEGSGFLPCATLLFWFWAGVEPFV